VFRDPDPVQIGRSCSASPGSGYKTLAKQTAKLKKGGR
jgi:hypothetical protein